MALLASGQRVVLREVQLRDLPEQMLHLSRKGTVPMMLGAEGEVIEESLDVMLWCLQQQSFLVTPQFCLADAAILPFVRQFAGVEPDWFQQSRYEALRAWLTRMLESEFFALVMQKYPTWKAGDSPVYFPAAA